MSLSRRIAIIALRAIGCIAIVFAMISCVVWLSYYGAAMFVNYDPDDARIAGLSFLLTIAIVVVGIIGIIFVAMYKSDLTQEDK